MRKLLTGLAVAVSITVAACGGAGVDNDEAEKIRDHATEIQRDAQQAAEEVRNGTKDAEQAAEGIQDDMNGLADETIDAAKGENLPPEAEAQLEAAQDQLNAQK